MLQNFIKNEIKVTQYFYFFLNVVFYQNVLNKTIDAKVNAKNSRCLMDNLGFIKKRCFIKKSFFVLILYLNGHLKVELEVTQNSILSQKHNTLAKLFL